MQKKKKYLYIIVSSFLLLFINGIGYFTIREFAIKPFLHHDKSLFEEEKYKDAYGGSYADFFFERSVFLTNNSTDKEFYYLEGSNSWRLLHYCDSVFYLEITSRDYEKDKETLFEIYSILDEDIYDDLNNLDVKKSYSKNNYDFFTVDFLASFSNPPVGMKYPGCFGMIGFNDTSKTLSLIFFFSPSLDYIENMDNFMKTNLFFIL